jgi:hypothetical protein
LIDAKRTTTKVLQTDVNCFTWPLILLLRHERQPNRRLLCSTSATETAEWRNQEVRPPKNGHRRLDRSFLMIALWRFVIDGVMLEGAVMKPSI